MLGFVEDLRSVYEHADVAVVPLLRGGGSPLKFVEALAYGLPVIASPHAAGCSRRRSGHEHFLWPPMASSSPRAVVSLLEDPGAAARLGAAGRKLAERRYSIDALATLLAG